MTPLTWRLLRRSMPHSSHETMPWQEPAAKCGSRWYEVNSAAHRGASRGRREGKHDGEDPKRSHAVPFVVSLNPAGPAVRPYTYWGYAMTKRTFALICLVCLGTIAAIALPNHPPASSPADAATLHVTIQEWTVPTKGAHPHDPAVGVDGALWFTEQMVNKLGRLDPKTGEFKEYPLATDKNSGPHGLVADNEGNIWF